MSGLEEAEEEKVVADGGGGSADTVIRDEGSAAQERYAHAVEV